MRKACTVGVKEDGSQVVLIPDTEPISKHLSFLRELYASGPPKGHTRVALWTSDGRMKTIEPGAQDKILAARKRSEEKAKNRNAWLKKQDEQRKASSDKQAKERQQRIDDANAEKEERKKQKTLAANAKTQTTTPTPKTT